MKKCTILLSLLMVVMLVGGCGQSDMSSGTDTTSVDTASTQASSSDVVMQMLWFNDGIEGDIMQEILDMYYEDTGVKIEMVVIGWDDYSTKLRTMIRGGEPPALVRGTEGTAAEFKDFIVSLDGIYDDGDYTNIYYNSDGESISLPLDLTANGLFYNKDLFDKYGVNYPGLGDEVWTWEEFELEMEKLMGKDDVAYPGVFDDKAHRFVPMIYQFGGELWGDSYDDPKWDSDAAVEALSTLQRMNTNGTLDPSVWAGTGSANELFRTGMYGFHMSGNWFVANYQDLPFEWGVTPMPIGNGADAQRATVLGGKGIMAIEGSGYEQEALDFIAYLSQPEIHDIYTSGVPFLSPRLSSDVDFGVYQDAYEVFQDEIANTPPELVDDWLKQVDISGMYPVINTAIESAMGGKDVELVLDELAAELVMMAEEQGLD